eukprot:6185379-Prymnesium_polylepis.1
MDAQIPSKEDWIKRTFGSTDTIIARAGVEVVWAAKPKARRGLRLRSRLGSEGHVRAERLCFVCKHVVPAPSQGAGLAESVRL